ncbi:MAG: InlB B-repeat-containing protein [Lachnospiraceae bacterium]|nr:InlB B-repeat-containing protein [Lachnospiraceae bacterium]
MTAKRLFRRIMVILLSALIVMSNLSMTAVAYAQEDASDDGGDQSEPSGDPEDPAGDPGNPDPDPASDPDPAPDPDPPAPIPDPPTPVSLNVDPDVISYGTVAKSDSSDTRRINVTNTCTVNGYVTAAFSDANLAYRATGNGQTDGRGRFILNPGDSMYFTVYPADGLDPGDYDSTFTITAFNDDGVPTAEDVDISMKVKGPDKPVVDSVVISPGKSDQTPGSTVAFSAQVNGSNLTDTSVSWSLDGQKSGGTTLGSDGTLRIAQDESATSVMVTAVSNADKSKKDTAMVNIIQTGFTLALAADPKSGGKVAGGGVYANGQTPTITAVSNSGYKFQGWYDMAGSKVYDKGTFTVPAITSDVKYVAKFKRNTCYVSVDVNDDDGGSVDGGGSVAYGGSMKLKAKKKDGYSFTGWSEDGDIFAKDEEITLGNITEDRSIRANFKKYDFTVCVQPYPDYAGKVDGGGKYRKGDTVSLKASAYDGYSFRGWMYNNQFITNCPYYDVKNLDRDACFTAVFDRIGATVYTIEAGVANKGGTISPTGKTAVTQGADITYTIAPSNGYKVFAVAVDNKQIGPVSSYTFKSVNANHTIAVAFAPKEDSVLDVKMDKIISTQEAAAIAASKLEKAGDGSEKRSSEIVTGDSGDGSSAKETATIEEVEKIPEQNLVGMDDTENIVETGNEYDYSKAEGLYQVLDITPQEAEQMIKSGNDSSIIKAAYDHGYLTVTVNNEYTTGNVIQELGYANLLENNATIENLLDLIESLLTEDDKLDLMEGYRISLNFSATGTDENAVGDKERQAMNSINGVVVGDYFDMVLVKTVDEVTEVVSETPVRARITLMIPEDMKQDGREYCVVEDHDGNVFVLDNVGNDPNSVTVEVNEFSTFAFAYKSTEETAKKGPGALIVWIIVLIGVLATALGAVFIIRRKGR